MDWIIKNTWGLIIIWHPLTGALNRAPNSCLRTKGRLEFDIII